MPETANNSQRGFHQTAAYCRTIPRDTSRRVAASERRPFRVFDPHRLPFLVRGGTCWAVSAANRLKPGLQTGDASYNRKTPPIIAKKDRFDAVGLQETTPCGNHRKRGKRFDLVSVAPADYDTVVARLLEPAILPGFFLEDSRMTCRISFAARWLLVCALTVVLCPLAWADPVAPGPSDRQITLAVTKLVQQEHLLAHDAARLPSNTEISERCLTTLLKSLDPMKVYFYQSDIDEFMKHKDELCDRIDQGRHQFRLRGVSHVPATGRRTGGNGQSTAGRSAGFHRRRADGGQPRRGPISAHARRGRRSLAAANQVRHAPLEVGRQEGRKERGAGSPRQAHPPLQQLRQTDAPDQQRRTAGDLSERLHSCRSIRTPTTCRRGRTRTSRSK